LPQKSEWSANGAEYESQGQARSASPLVTDNHNVPALKGRNFLRISAFQASLSSAYGNPRATRFALALGFYISRRWRSPSDFGGKTALSITLTLLLDFGTRQTLQRKTRGKILFNR
jgi:hypothetical protein